jgi:hypothetical protein
MAFPLNDHLIQDEMDENQESSPRKGSITIHYVYVHDTPNSFVFFHSICDDLYLMTGHRSVMVSHPPK